MRWVFALLVLFAPPAASEDLPEWFVESFLEIREDAAEAAKDGKRLMLYFMQDGCPYCKQLVTVNFRDPRIVERMRRHFVPVAINIYGDREVTTPEGRKLPEKRYAAALKVQFTPTLVFFDDQGAVVHRINGYLPPDRFYTALEAAMGRAAPKAASAAATTVDLRRRNSAKPIAVLLMSPGCDACEELERHLQVPEVRAEVDRFELVRAANPAVLRLRDASHEVASTYEPALVFFAHGREVFRTDAYLRPFHLASAFDYVASGSYAREPSFQRFLQSRADRLRKRGERVDLWN